MELTQSELQETLSYDPETGLFHWKKPRKKVVVGAVAGTTDKNGYRVIKLQQRLYFAHRLAWLYVYGRWPDGLIDHRDHDPGNNRISNLRECNNSQNQQNRRGADRTSKTGVLGVSPQVNMFIATICAEGRQIYLGHFQTVEEASFAYQEAKKAYHRFAA